LHTSQETADYFATKLQDTCKPNSEIKNEYLKSKFEAKCLQYKNLVYDRVNIDINNVSSVVMNLKIGKPPGFDEIAAEHLQYAHPIVLSCLNVLFQLILKYHLVPDDFAKGITIPILKDCNRSLNQAYDDFRGIAINPVVSKVFECCLMTQIFKYLITDK